MSKKGENAGHGESADAGVPSGALSLSIGRGDLRAKGIVLVKQSGALQVDWKKAVQLEFFQSDLAKTLKLVEGSDN